MSDDGTPRLCDFGRSKIVNQNGFTTALAGSQRFMAPELLVADELGTLTKETDVYVFGMTVLQVNLPFSVWSTVAYKLQQWS